MFPIRSHPTSHIAPLTDEPMAGPSRPPVQPRQHAIDYAARRLGISKDDYIRWSVETALQNGPVAISAFPTAPEAVAATQATLAAFAANSWEEMATPYIQEWHAASSTVQATHQKDSPSSPLPQPGAASQQARMRNDWAAQQALPRASSSSMDEDHSRPDSRIPLSRENSVDHVITQTIQAAKKRKIGKTGSRILNIYRQNIDALNAKTERSSIPVDAALEIYRERVSKKAWTWVTQEFGSKPAMTKHLPRHRQALPLASTEAGPSSRSEADRPAAD